MHHTPTPHRCRGQRAGLAEVQLDLLAATITPKRPPAAATLSKAQRRQRKRHKAMRKKVANAAAKLERGQKHLVLKVRKTDRKIAFRHREHEAATSGLRLGDEAVAQCHTALLRKSLDSLKAHCEKRSLKAAEIVAWINRRKPDEPFSFETCCAVYREVDEDGDTIGPFDPEVLRTQVRLLIKRAFGAELPHADVLRQGILDAEAGDDDAVEWILSNRSGPLSFVECCKAIGFRPDAAREQIAIGQYCPTATSFPDGLETVVDKAIQAAIAA